MEKETAVVRMAEVEREKTGFSEKSQKNWAILRIKGEVNGKSCWATVKSFGREKPGTLKAFMKNIPCLCECQQGEKEMEYILKEVAESIPDQESGQAANRVPYPAERTTHDQSIKERLIVAQNSLTNAVAFCNNTEDPDAVIAIQMRFFHATWQLAHGLKEAESEEIDDVPF